MIDRSTIPPAWQAAQRVLVVRLDNLGDVLVTTPAIHAISQSLPHAQITLLASPVGAQVGRINPDIDDVIVYEAPWVDPWCERPHDSAREQRMIEEIKARQFDGAIIFTSFRQSSLPAAYLCYLADIPLRVAASIDAPGSLLTTRHKHPDRTMHEAERGLDLVGAIGMTTDERQLVLRTPILDWGLPILGWTDGSGVPLKSKIQHPQSPIIVIHPGCTMPARTYPPDMFAAVADLLIERLDATVLLTGVQSERSLVDQIRSQIRPEHRDRAVPCAGELPFDQFCALIETAALVITNNTGPMHIAAALQTPVVALFALTNPPEQWGPWQVRSRVLYHDVPCRICYSRVCPVGHECLRLVTPDMVLDASAALLTERRMENREWSMVNVQ